MIVNNMFKKSMIYNNLTNDYQNINDLCEYLEQIIIRDWWEHVEQK